VSVFGVQVGIRMWASGLGCWVVVVVGVVGGVVSSGWCWGVGGGGGGWLSSREQERMERGRVNRIIYFYMSAVSVLYHIPQQIPLPVTEGYLSKGLQDSENLTFHCTSEYTPAPTSSRFPVLRPFQ